MTAAIIRWMASIPTWSRIHEERQVQIHGKAQRFEGQRTAGETETKTRRATGLAWLMIFPYHPAYTFGKFGTFDKHRTHSSRPSISQF